MAENGISLFLERIQQNPGDERWMQRFLALVAEEPDSMQKCAELLLVAQTCSIAQPVVALQIVLAVFRYARDHEGIEEMRRAAKISMACLKALGRIGAAKAIRLELERIGAPLPPPSASGHLMAPPPIKDEINSLDAMIASAVAKSSLSPPRPASPGEIPALPLSASYGTEKTDAAFLAVIDPVERREEETISKHRGMPAEVAVERFENIAPAAVASIPWHVPQPERRETAPFLEADPIAEGETQSRIRFANKHQLLTDSFWAKLYQTISTTKDRFDLCAQFPNKNGLLHFLGDHFRSMGIVLPQKTSQKLVGLLHGDADFTAEAFRESITVCLWHGLGAAPVAKLLDIAGLGEVGAEYWGFYLDLLLLVQNARRAWYEIRRTINSDSSESWAAAAYARLPSVCKKLKLQEFSWEPGSGTKTLVHLLASRPPPTLRGFLVGR